MSPDAPAMHATRRRLLETLADGAPHSGEALAERLAITRAAVWKHVSQLREAGYPIEATAGRGYQWRQPWALHTAEGIRTGLGPLWQHIPITVLPEVDSTNNWLREHAPATPAVAIAERQTRGRGRLARSWSSPPGGLYISVAWHYDALEAGPAGLGLLVAVQLADRLRALGAREVGVKWPNDLLYRGAKLAGVLCELTGDPLGACTVIVGTGLNWRGEGVGALDADRRAIGVADLFPDPPSRPELTGRLTGAILDACAGYPERFANTMRERWPTLDALRGRRITLQLSDRQIIGTARGVDDTGALLLETPQGLQRHLSGDTRILHTP